MSAMLLDEELHRQPASAAGTCLVPSLKQTTQFIRTAHPARAHHTERLKVEYVQTV